PSDRDPRSRLRSQSRGRARTRTARRGRRYWGGTCALCSGSSALCGRVVDRGPPDWSMAPGRVGNPPVIRQPLQAPATVQLPVVLQAQEPKLLHVGLSAPRPRLLVVTLGPLRRPVAARP